MYVETGNVDLAALAEGGEELLSSPTRGISITRSSRSIGGQKHDFEAPFTKLNNILGPLVSRLAGMTKPDELIWIIPHRVLHRVPFHAIEYDGQPLGLRNPVVYSPNLTSMKYCLRRGPILDRSKASTFIAYVPMEEDKRDAKESWKSFKNEAEIVSSHTDSKLDDILSETQVTKETFLNHARTADIIHFAGHGYYDSVDPKNSGILVVNQINYLGNSTRISTD